MPKKATFKVTSTPRGWKVEVPGRISKSGDRERMYFKTREKAKEYASKLRDDRDAHGAGAAIIRPALAEEALQAAAMLEPFGVSLLEAARRIVEIETTDAASEAVSVALSTFLLSKETKSESQQRAYLHMQAAFVEEFGQRKLSSITQSELVRHAEANTGTNSTFNRRMTSIKTFWRWCARSPRSWCDSKVVENLETKHTTRSEISVLTAGQCKALLTAAETHYPECVPAFAISLFTGIRKAELERLEPGDISEAGITVSAESAKTKRRRFIEMPAPLAAWLKAYPVGDTVLPTNWLRKDKAVRRLAGWKLWCNLVEPFEPPDELPEWPDNALRHTHASVMVALGKSLDNLTFEFGHSGGAAVLKSHYVGVMSKADAIAIWSTGPSGAIVPVIHEVA